jgi:RsiW-degrading membrane proteinase PrsW (M82 family)
VSDAVQAARPQPFRPVRYVVAGVLGAVVALLATASSAASVLFSSAPWWQILLFGVIAIALCGTGVVFCIRSLARVGGERHRDLVRGGALLVVGFAFWILTTESAALYEGAPAGTVLTFAIACLPTTAFGLWVLRRLDRNEKEPWRLMLVAVVWGAVIAPTLALWGNTLWQFAISNNLPPGPAANQSLGFSAGIIEEISKGLAVVMLYLVMRNEFDDVVDGIVYGAAVGLGFNYMESILYMTRTYVMVQGVSPGAGTIAAFFQWGMRQGLGLFTGHATYTAMIGAGVGIARQMPRRWQRLLAILAGFLGAIAAHMVWDSWIASGGVPGNAGLALLFVFFREAVGNGGFLAIVLLLLVMGLRAEGNALEEHLAAEAATGRGAVLPQEIRLLTSPWRRFAERFQTLTSRGFRAWIQVSRLRNAQLDLGMERWHRARQEIDEPLEAEEALRQRVLQLRTALAAPPPGQPPTAAWQPIRR